jgi:hypothetical protein
LSEKEKNISENISNKKILNKTFNEINKINISEKKINKNTSNLANLTQVNGQNRGIIGSSKKKTNIKNYISDHSQINKSSFVENANLSKTNNTRNKNVVQKIDELQKKEEQFIQENSYLTKNQESSYGMRILHKLIKRRKVFYKLVFLHRGKFNS